jgi:phosphatidylserine/phosphatidylglycerophosphate/cardiolipin synthase-like enzyme
MLPVLPLLLLAMVAAAPFANDVAHTDGPERVSLRRTFETMGPGGAADATALDDSADAWAMRWRLLAEARQTIDATYFIVENDVFGLAFIAHLYMRAQQGVQVRLVLDGRGSAPFALPFLGLDEVQELVAPTSSAEPRGASAPPRCTSPSAP